MTKYRLNVANRVAVRIRGKIDGETVGTHTNVDFTLTMDRVSQEQVTADQKSGEPIADYLIPKTHAWDGQRLVLDETTGTPAAFNEEAYRVLLSQPGMAIWIYRAWLDALGVKEKN